jgi:hypothetical protein
MGGGIVLFVSIVSSTKSPLSYLTYGYCNPDGPVLTPTELYLLNPELQLNPTLMNANTTFHLVFNLLTGSFLL